MTTAIGNDNNTTDPAPLLERLRPALAESAAPVLTGPGTLEERVAREREAVRARQDAEARGVARRLRLLILVVTAMAGLFGAVVLGLAIVVPDVVAALTIAYDILVGGLFVAIVGGLVWKRGTGTAALWSMVVGTVGTLGTMGWLELNAAEPFEGVFANEPIYVGLAASAVVYVLLSLMTRPTDPAVLEAWRVRSRHGVDPAVRAQV